MLWLLIKYWSRRNETGEFIAIWWEMHRYTTEKRFKPIYNFYCKLDISKNILIILICMCTIEIQRFETTHLENVIIWKIDLLKLKMLSNRLDKISCRSVSFYYKSITSIDITFCTGGFKLFVDSVFCIEYKKNICKRFCSFPKQFKIFNVIWRFYE